MGGEEWASTQHLLYPFFFLCISQSKEPREAFCSALEFPSGNNSILGSIQVTLLSSPLLFFSLAHADPQNLSLALAFPHTLSVAAAATIASPVLPPASRYVATDLATDIVINVGEVQFYLHKFPLLSRSACLQKLVADTNEENNNEICIHEIPGGPAAFEICAKFCYDTTLLSTRCNHFEYMMIPSHHYKKLQFGDHFWRRGHFFVVKAIFFPTQGSISLVKVSV
ncbi:uncharacterized protein LOC114264518 isoform X2 [Camellia sinensis]|uniref:uncharacterized protein LOC114264518 isoform X2 n=1 Tax=Camellia sinensis TaxID=4442 RepID=UPI00103614B0|nr:uncharacterized protein LOC114264518 isoform X2 [Camellia sinensis]